MGKKYKKFLIFISIFFIFNTFLFAQEEGGESEDIYKKAIFYVLEDSKDLYQIGTMGMDGEDKKVLTKTGNNWCPALSPDGSKIAFFSDRSGFTNLWLMNAGGAGQKQLTFNKENIIKIDLRDRGQLAWEKEGEEILFLRNNDIWRIDKTGETPSAITKCHDVTSFKIAPDGNRILFSREKTRRHNGLWTMSVNGTNLRQIAESLIINPVFDWGDNGTIVYFHNRGISTVTYYGINKTFVKETFYLDNDLSWSKTHSDRKQNLIAYLSDKRKGPNIWVMSYDGKAEEQVTEKGGFSPFWLPDGQTMLYVEENDIYKINIDTKEKIRLTYYFRSFYPLLADVKIHKWVVE